MSSSRTTFFLALTCFVSAYFIDTYNLPTASTSLVLWPVSILCGCYFGYCSVRNFFGERNYPERQYWSEGDEDWF